MKCLLESIINEIESYAEPDRVEILEKYFKVFRGGYGEVDDFIGVRVPNLRRISKHYCNFLNSNDLSKLMSSNKHEYRLTATFIVVLKFGKEKSETIRNKWVSFYLDHLNFINN